AALDLWWEGAARAAIDCQVQGATVEVLEETLAKLGKPGFAAPANTQDAEQGGAEGSEKDTRVMARLRAPQGIEDAFGQAAPLVLQALRGTTLWWPCVDGADVVLLRGLPDTEDFPRLLDGSL